MGRVLIAESDLEVYEIVSKLVRKIDSHAEIHFAEHVQEAFSYSEQNNVDLFILRIQFKDGDGMMLAKMIREKDPYKFTPIIFISDDDYDLLTAVQEIHCYDYILKPFNSERVLESFRNIIQQDISKNVEKKVLCIKQKNSTCVIEQKNIIYVEMVDRKLYLKCKDKTITVSATTLNEMHLRLSDSFMRCHKGFLINKKYVERIDKSNRQIQLKNNIGVVPFGEKYVIELNRLWD